MDTFALFSLVTITVWAMLGFKLIYDQQSLLKQYRKVKNPPYPLLPNEVGSPKFAGRINPVTHSLRLFRIPFTGYPHDPDLARLAMKVRVDIALLVIVAISAVVVFVNIEI
jgi:hypothetical protein